MSSSAFLNPGLPRQAHSLLALQPAPPLIPTNCPQHRTCRWKCTVDLNAVAAREAAARVAPSALLITTMSAISVTPRLMTCAGWTVHHNLWKDAVAHTAQYRTEQMTKQQQLLECQACCPAAETPMQLRLASPANGRRQRHACTQSTASQQPLLPRLQLIAAHRRQHQHKHIY